MLTPLPQAPVARGAGVMEHHCHENLTAGLAVRVPSSFGEKDAARWNGKSAQLYGWIATSIPFACVGRPRHAVFHR
jgi:hypothetical protein